MHCHDGEVHDIAIVGSGPAAWSAAAACTLRGLSVCLIAPAPELVWAQTYGVWTDQIDASVASMLGDTSIEAMFVLRWAQVLAIGSSTRNLKREYAQLNNGVLREAFHATAEKSGLLRVVAAGAKMVEHHDASSTISLTKGRGISARIVVDASGASSGFVERESFNPQPVMQSAYGVIASFDDDPFPSGHAVLMDWRGPQRKDPSFLYALDRCDGTWLVEETSLARTPPLSPKELEQRLHKRLELLGARINQTFSVEHVLFPMNVPIPVLHQRTVAIGAAAGVVHPATGYSVSASLRNASRLAESFVRSMDSSSAAPSVIAKNAWNVVWSADRRKARGLESYGLERLLTMNQDETRAFFDAFFSLDSKLGAVYLSGEASSAELAAVMWKVFQKAPFRLRQRLATGNPLALARSLLA
jgi:lycopene cyclase-like protein